MHLLLFFVFFLSIFLTGLLTKRITLNTWPIATTFFFAICFYSAILHQLTRVEIDSEKNELSLMKTNSLEFKKIAKYPLKEIQFTYKVGKPGRYARIRNICRLYLRDKQIAAIIPDYDGWTDASVDDLVSNLVSYGVTKKFIGYSSKDAKINGL